MTKAKDSKNFARYLWLILSSIRGHFRSRIEWHLLSRRCCSLASRSGSWEWTPQCSWCPRGRSSWVPTAQGSVSSTPLCSCTWTLQLLLHPGLHIFMRGPGSGCSRAIEWCEDCPWRGNFAIGCQVSKRGENFSSGTAKFRRFHLHTHMKLLKTTASSDNNRERKRVKQV